MIEWPLQRIAGIHQHRSILHRDSGPVAWSSEERMYMSYQCGESGDEIESGIIGFLSNLPVSPPTAFSFPRPPSAPISVSDDHAHSLGSSCDILFSRHRLHEQSSSIRQGRWSLHLYAYELCGRRLETSGCIQHWPLPAGWCRRQSVRIELARGVRSGDYCIKPQRSGGPSSSI